MSRRKPSRQNTEMEDQASRGNPVPKLSPDIKSKIGQQLRTMYSEVVDQGVPDRFVEILRGLDDAGDQGSEK
jgi:hypothetical protein